MQTLETILTLSAEQIAGARTLGRPSGEIRWHGSQSGKIKLADREVKVKRPRLHHKAEGEETAQDRGLQQLILGALMRGVSTREYDEVLAEMAETVGVSRSSVSCSKPRFRPAGTHCRRATALHQGQFSAGCTTIWLEKEAA